LFSVQLFGGPRSVVAVHPALAYATAACTSNTIWLRLKAA